MRRETFSSDWESLCLGLAIECSSCLLTISVNLDNKIGEEPIFIFASKPYIYKRNINILV